MPNVSTRETRDKGVDRGEKVDIGWNKYTYKPPRKDIQRFLNLILDSMRKPTWKQQLCAACSESIYNAAKET